MFDVALAGITSVFELYSVLDDKWHITPICMGIIFIYCVFRFLLQPIFGSQLRGGLSDSVISVPNSTYRPAPSDSVSKIEQKNEVMNV